MSDIIDGIKDVLVEDHFHVFDSLGNPVNGLLEGAFTMTLLNPSWVEVSASLPMVILFISNGEYAVLWYPDDSGHWSGSVYHPTYEKKGWHSQYMVRDAEFSIHTIDQVQTVCDIAITENESIIIIKGLSKWNLRIDTINYNDDNKMENAQISIHASGADVDTGDNALHTFTASAEYVNKLLTLFKYKE